MHMKLFSIGPLNVYSYGLMIALGIIAAVWLAMRRCPDRGLDKDQMFNMGFLGIVVGVIGAKLMYYIVELPAILQDPSLLLDITNGFVVYGGIITGILAPYIYARVKKLPFLKYLDTAIPAIPLAQGLGRIGCFLAGCCYGRPTDAWFGVIFPADGLAPAGVSLIPTQLFSSIGDFAIAAFLLWYTRKGKERQEGMAVGWYTALYAVGRFIIEFFRDDPRGMVGFLSTSQFIAVIMLVAAIVWICLCQKRRKAKEEAEAEEKVDAELAAEQEEREQREQEWKKIGQALRPEEPEEEDNQDSE